MVVLLLGDRPDPVDEVERPGEIGEAIRPGQVIRLLDRPLRELIK